LTDRSKPAQTYMNILDWNTNGAQKVTILKTECIVGRGREQLKLGEIKMTKPRKTTMNLKRITGFLLENIDMISENV